MPVSTKPYAKLRGRILEVFGTNREFAKALGISLQTVSAKLNKKRPWTDDEIKKAMALLELPLSEISPYFF